MQFFVSQKLKENINLASITFLCRTRTPSAELSSCSYIFYMKLNMTCTFFVYCGHSYCRTLSKNCSLLILGDHCFRRAKKSALGPGLSAGARNIKYKAPQVAAILFMTSFLTGTWGGGAWPPCPPPPRIRS